MQSADLESHLKEMNKLVEEIDKEDPWVKKHFGISGCGEGIVWYPLNLGNIPQHTTRIDISLFNRFCFKAKGATHGVVVQKQPIQAKLEIPSGAADYVDMFVTEGRLEQGVREACADKFDKKDTGKFIIWMVKDIQKEGKQELQAAGLDWKQVDPLIKTKAKEWYLKKCT